MSEKLSIDLEAGTLSVRLTLQRIKMPGEAKGRLILKEPKRSSRRVLNLPKAILSELAAHQRRQDEERALAGVNAEIRISCSGCSMIEV